MQRLFGYEARMRINIYQIDGDKDTNRVKFDSYHRTLENGGIDPSVYKCVFHGDVDGDLEDVYMLFDLPDNHAPEQAQVASLGIRIGHRGRVVSVLQLDLGLGEGRGYGADIGDGSLVVTDELSFATAVGQQLAVNIQVLSGVIHGCPEDLIHTGHLRFGQRLGVVEIVELIQLLQHHHGADMQDAGVAAVGHQTQVGDALGGIGGGEQALEIRDQAIILGNRMGLMLHAESAGGHTVTPPVPVEPTAHGAETDIEQVVSVKGVQPSQARACLSETDRIANTQFLRVLTVKHIRRRAVDAGSCRIRNGGVVLGGPPVIDAKTVGRLGRGHVDQCLDAVGGHLLDEHIAVKLDPGIVHGVLPILVGVACDLDIPSYGQRSVGREQAHGGVGGPLQAKDGTEDPQGIYAGQIQSCAESRYVGKSRCPLIAELQHAEQPLQADGRASQLGGQARGQAG
ncbi:MAG: hypothetical protein J6B09_00305 [Clostridia bacterium]|nr:hypothetical protein [Clostridia bacterium]